MSTQEVHNYVGSLITDAEERIDQAIVERDNEAASIIYSSTYKEIENVTAAHCWKLSSVGVPAGLLIGVLSGSTLLGVTVMLVVAATAHAGFNPKNKWKSELLALKASSERNLSWL